ncbi:MAG TPA: hypothetical protein VFX92_01195 [Candidatus Krumholzibacteria bacterium]|nr:hypothetical protein [Candidatus Krumholzibacteria bacterium]
MFYAFTMAVSLLAQIQVAGPEPEYLSDLRYCDVVVQGVVESSVVELEPRMAAMPMLQGGNHEQFVKVARVTLRVQKVLRGTVTGAQIEFVSFVGTSIFTDNYRPGQETVLGLVWGEDVLGGSYWLFSEYGRFVRGPAGWVSQRGTSLEDLNDLENALDAIAPRQLLRRAEIVVVGEIGDTRLSTVGGPEGKGGVVMSIDLRDVRVLSGTNAPSELTVVQVLSGEYWPTWRDSAPLRIAPDLGKCYCLFLRRGVDGFSLVGGINGAFEVRESHLYFAGRTRVDLTIQQIIEQGEQ